MAYLKRYALFFAKIREVLLLTLRGGQKTAKPDPPDQSGRPAHPPARPLTYIRTDTDTDILNIRITDG
jgi:hypothetical protein